MKDKIMKNRRIQTLIPSDIDESVFAPIYEKEILVPEELNIKHGEFKKMNSQKQNEWLEKLRIHLLDLAINKNHGIFSTNKDLDEIVRDIKDLNNYNTDRDLHFVNDKKYLTHGSINPSDQWFPEMSSTKINGKSLIDMLKSPKYFHQNLRDILGKDRHKVGINSNGEKRISQFLISSLRIVNRFQPAFNYAATLAKFLYSTFVDEYFDNKNDELWIYDPCAGWSGRMSGLLSAFCTNKFKNLKVKYYCTDVNKDTVGRFERIVKFWNHYINSRIKKDFKLYRSFVGAEMIFTDPVFNNLRNKFDMAFTSPPYFDREIYSNDENQSGKLYPKYEQWRNGFLKPMIENTYHLLKPGGHFWLNIADINTNKGNNTFYPLEDDAVTIAKQTGFLVVDIYYMTAHIFPGNDSSKNKIILEGKEKKYEPIFLFMKPFDKNTNQEIG